MSVAMRMGFAIAKPAPKSARKFTPLPLDADGLPPNFFSALELEVPKPPLVCLDSIVLNALNGKMVVTGHRTHDERSPNAQK